MEITLEKIELVRDRTGVSYKEAKEALEAADGSVVDAIVAIEAAVDGGVARSTIEKKDALVSRIKEIVEKGNVSRIKVTKEDSTIVNLPLSAGILGTLLAPWAAIAGVVAAFGFKCKIEFVKDDGTVIDLSEKAEGVYDNVKEKGQDIYFDIKERAPENFDDLRAKGEEAFNKAKDKGESVFSKAKDAVTSSVDKFKEGMKGVKEDFEEFDFEEEVEEVVEEVKEAVDEVVEEVKDEE